MDYTTIRTNYDLRLATRGQLKGVWRKMALAIIIFVLIGILLPSFLWNHASLGVNYIIETAGAVFWR